MKSESLILWPVIAVVCLTASVWVLMYIRRITEIRTNGINPQELNTREKGTNRLKDVTAADNFNNLLEVPVLFYVICVILFVSAEVATLQVVLAWIYVVLRAVHSVIHVTYNNVVHRWGVYVTSTVCLFAMWGIFTFSLLRASAGQ